MKTPNTTAIIIEIGLFIVVGLLLLIYMVEQQGIIFSISSYVQYYSTAYVLKLFLILTAIGVYRNEILRPATVPALGIAVFDSVHYNQFLSITHDISAITFFIILTASMVINHRSRIFGILLALSFPIYPFVGLFVGEMISISIIYLYLIYKMMMFAKWTTLNIKD